MMKNIAHRGFSAAYPENTMLAFRKAVEAGCDGIEMDIRVCKSGELVVIHDSDVSRVTQGIGKVGDMTLDQLKKLNVKAGFGDIYGFNEIPTLEEYFDYIQTKDVFTNIEIKRGSKPGQEIEKKLIELINKYNLMQKVIISSFDHYSIMRCKEIAPSIKCGLLMSDGILHPGKYAKHYGVECIHPNYITLNEEIIRETLEYGIEINVYTVNDQDVMQHFISSDVTGIITDYPDRLRHVLNMH